jgi:hypothetical protein
MYLLATSFYNGYYHLVDNIWEPTEFYNDEYTDRARRHSLQFNIIDMVEKGEYDICIFKTCWLSIFQRILKKRYKSS